MGKVRKLRKKYKALCSKNLTMSNSSILKENSKISVLPAKRNTDCINVHILDDKIVFKNKYEVLKNKSEAVTRISNQKFYNVLSGVLANQSFTMCRKYSQGVSQFGDDLPLSKERVGLKISSRKLKNYPRKQATKIRHKNLIQDINAFKRTLKEGSFLKNPQTVVMNQTLKRLSAECSFNPKEKNV